MTREEREDAIDIIQSILDKYEEDECLVTEITIGDEDIKALKMAIKALEQEPTTKNDLVHNICDSCTNIGCELQSGIVRTKCAFYMSSVTPQEPTIKALGEELRKTRKGIADEKVLIGYNMAVAICNKHLGESEE